MKKQDLKKLALMGITGGLLLGTQCPLKAEVPDLDQTIAMRNGCGGSGDSGGCGGTKPNGNGNGKMNGNGNGNGNGKMNGNGNGKNACGPGGCGSKKPNGNGNNNRNRMNNMDRKQEVSMSGGTVSDEKALSESDMMQQLNPEMKAKYQNMSPEGKALALKLANQACNGKEGGFKDKNMAVKAAADKMMQKRQKLHSN